MLLLIFTMCAALSFVMFWNPFLKAQKSGWYPLFLQPVVENILTMPTAQAVLDIGTGPGKLLELLNKESFRLKLTGIDINPGMIRAAQKRIKKDSITFQLMEPGKPLAFVNDQFDVVTFCSVLFLLNDTSKEFLLNDALRVLKPGGKIIVLTPSGKKAAITSLLEIWQYPFSLFNWTFLLWKLFTSGNAKKWAKQNWLNNYATQQSYQYTSQEVFNGNAFLETLKK